MKQVNTEADRAEDTLRVSMDAKAIVNVGPFARRGKNRLLTKAVDQDFHPEATVTPVGIFLPATDEFFCFGVTSKVTSDCLVEWWESVKNRFYHIKILHIHLDNRPENHSRRTQFMYRLLEFSKQYQIHIHLLYHVRRAGMWKQISAKSPQTT